MSAYRPTDPGPPEAGHPSQSFPDQPVELLTVTRKHRFLLAAAAAALSTGVASAQLGFTKHGPIDPNNGFPTNYTDTNGLSLDLCITDPIFCGLVAPVNLSRPGQPFPINY